MRPGHLSEGGAVQVPIAGITLLSLLLFITVQSMMMARAAETWDSQVRHELELELIFRGEDYQRGIERYFETNKRLPAKLEELCPEEVGNVRYVRRCWSDPITNEDFRLIFPGSQGQKKKDREATEEVEGDDEDLFGGFAREGPTRSDVEYGMPGTASKIEWSGDRPFIGVASSSDLTGFRSYLDTEHYAEWEFVAVINTAGSRSPQNPNGVPNSQNPNGVPNNVNPNGSTRGNLPVNQGGFGNQGGGGASTQGVPGGPGTGSSMQFPSGGPVAPGQRPNPSSPPTTGAEPPGN